MEAKNLLLLGFLPRQDLMENETWYRQSGKGVGKYKGFPTSSQNFVNFGPQTA